MVKQCLHKIAYEAKIEILWACQWAMALLQAMVQPMAQRPKPVNHYKPKIYTQIHRECDFTPWTKPLKHCSKSKSVIICPKVNFKNPTSKPTV